ncbi:hypothetical protein ACJZ2D_015879 [Fusarium nematophilum]
MFSQQHPPSRSNFDLNPDLDVFAVGAWMWATTECAQEEIDGQFSPAEPTLFDRLLDRLLDNSPPADSPLEFPTHRHLHRHVQAEARRDKLSMLERYLDERRPCSPFQEWAWSCN